MSICIRKQISQTRPDWALMIVCCRAPGLPARCRGAGAAAPVNAILMQFIKPAIQQPLRLLGEFILHFIQF